jgi:hypothetical protein
MDDAFMQALFRAVVDEITELLGTLK